MNLSLYLTVSRCNNGLISVKSDCCDIVNGVSKGWYDNPERNYYGWWINPVQSSGHERDFNQTVKMNKVLIIIVNFHRKVELFRWLFRLIHHGKTQT